MVKVEQSKTCMIGTTFTRLVLEDKNLFKKITGRLNKIFFSKMCINGMIFWFQKSNLFPQIQKYVQLAPFAKIQRNSL
jgi:hypothetical protein